VKSRSSSGSGGNATSRLSADRSGISAPVTARAARSRLGRRSGLGAVGTMANDQSRRAPQLVQNCSVTFEFEDDEQDDDVHAPRLER
jgi:hypothetical protein